MTSIGSIVWTQHQVDIANQKNTWHDGDNWTPNDAGDSGVDCHGVNVEVFFSSSSEFRVAKFEVSITGGGVKFHSHVLDLLMRESGQADEHSQL